MGVNGNQAARRYDYGRDQYHADRGWTRPLEQLPERQEGPERRTKGRAKPAGATGANRGIDFITMLLLVGVLGLTVFACFRYLDLQGRIKENDKAITSMEEQLSKLVDKNNAIEGQFDNAIDFDYIYKVAIGEMGMVFPDKNQSISYDEQIHEYVRQREDMEEVRVSALLEIIFP